MPELQTTLQWVAPWLERAASGMANDPGIISFSKAFERAQEQKSPFYQLQVQQLQSQIATMGYQMQRQKLGLEMDQAAKADILEGKRSASEMATEMSKVKNWTDPGALAALDAIYAKRPTKEGKAMLDEAAVRHKEAVAAQDRSEQNRLRAEATAARMETEIYKVGAKAFASWTANS